MSRIRTIINLINSMTYLNLRLLSTRYTVVDIRLHIRMVQYTTAVHSSPASGRT